MRRQQQLHDSKAGFRAHRGKHVGVFCNMLGILPCGDCHISIFAEIWTNVKSISISCRLKVSFADDDSFVPVRSAYSALRRMKNLRLWPEHEFEHLLPTGAHQ